MRKQSFVKKLFKALKRKNICRYIFLVGFFLLALSFLFEYHFIKRGQILNNLSSKQLYDVPRRIRIIRLGIDSLVTNGGIVQGKWVLSDNFALYVTSSGKLGEGYNTIIYAHNKAGLFAKLDEILLKEEIILEDSLGQQYTYQVFLLKHGSPRKVSLLYSDVPNTLTLFTCDGLFDSSRLIIQAKLI